MAPLAPMTNLYLLADERYLPEFTERVGGAPELPYAARRKLEGDSASA